LFQIVTFIEPTGAQAEKASSQQKQQGLQLFTHLQGVPGVMQALLSNELQE
jgi:hypothetical protein